IEGDALTVEILSGPQHGRLVMNADGSFTYTPDSDWYGTDGFSYRVTDGELVSAPASIALNVTPVNDAPQVMDLGVTLDEDTRVTLDLLQGARDVEGDALGMEVVSGPRHGRLELGVDGSFLYIPEADFHGEDRFTYRGNDGQADSAVAEVRIVVAPVNDAPVVSPLAATLLEDGRLVLDLLAQTYDVDGDPLTVSVLQPGQGQVTRNEDGTWTYTPEADYHGEDAFTFNVSDGQAVVAGVVRLTITAVNDAPVAHDDHATLNEDASIVLWPMSNDGDVDGDSLQLQVLDGPTHGVLVRNADGSLTYTPMADWSGEDRFTYRLSDGQTESGVATVRLVVSPVADAPTLVLSDPQPQTREVFRTGWESVADRSFTSTLVQARELEGWTLITRPDPSCGGSNGFEIWSTGDKMMDAWYRLRTVNAMAGNGDNWLELNNSAAVMHQTLGIERSVQTVAGARYTLSLDVAGRMGYGSDYTRIGIYVDGVRIGGDASTSGWQGLEWQARSVQFTGTGGTQSIRIVSEATRFDASGRGMMIDDIALTESLPANVGLEDSAIHLSAISAALRDMDGSETLAITLEALPVGSVLSDGVHRFTAVEGVTRADVSAWNLGQLSLTPPKDFAGSITLRVVATAIEQGNQAQASTSVDLIVEALPVNDAPVASDQYLTLDEDRSLRLTPLATDADGDALTLRVLAQPEHGLLVRNADGSFTYTPRAGWSGEDCFTYQANDGQVDSNVARVRLLVNPVADAPTLVLTAPPGMTRELFRTGWESVANLSGDSTLVRQAVLEGWALVTTPDAAAGGRNGFEVWSHGDRMADARGVQRIVTAAPGNGHNWLELNGAAGDMHQTLGIERSVQTVAGASYTLSLDLAGRMGYGADYTRIGIYVDGVRIGADASTSGRHGLSWQERSFQFTGTGGMQSIRIVSEATQLDANGRGMMIDDIVLSETLPANVGQEDSLIRLPVIGASLNDCDGSESLVLMIESVPVGAVLTDGVRSFTAMTGATTVDLAGWRLDRLDIRPPQDFTGSFVLKVVATATERGNQAQATTSADIEVQVLPFNTAPTAHDACFTLLRDGSVRIDFASLVRDAQGDALTLTLNAPVHGSLARNGDGSYTYRPETGYVGTDRFTYAVSDGQENIQASIDLLVLPGVWRASGSTVSLHSALACQPAAPEPDRYLVLRAPHGERPRVDWEATPAELDAFDMQATWLPALGQGQRDEECNLGDITGLVFPIGRQQR
ncbi:tandem-95 repeat protein, partial [Pseudomonas sp. NCHU5216]